MGDMKSLAEIVWLWAHFEATQLVGEEGEEERSGSYDVYKMSTDV